MAIQNAVSAFLIVFGVVSSIDSHLLVFLSTVGEKAGCFHQSTETDGFWMRLQEQSVSGVYL
jgi:hypothetical protein